MNNKNEILAVEKGYFVYKSGVAININTGREVGTKGMSNYKYIGFKGECGKVLKVYIHRLQAFQKYGHKIYDPNMVVRHLNGDSLDNSFDNIGIGTASDNMLDMPKVVRLRNARNAAKKYSDEDVTEIRRLHALGKTYSELMDIYGITSRGTLSHIINKRTLNA